MDRDFHTDDFERLLRENSDEFRLYPSKRIWHSVYNNIHPGRKWPSVAVSICLISGLFILGYLNTRNVAFLPEIASNSNQIIPTIPYSLIPQSGTITFSGMDFGNSAVKPTSKSTLPGNLVIQKPGEALSDSDGNFVTGQPISSQTVPHDEEVARYSTGHDPFLNDVLFIFPELNSVYTPSITKSAIRFNHSLLSSFVRTDIANDPKIAIHTITTTPVDLAVNRNNNKGKISVEGIKSGIDKKSLVAGKTNSISADEKKWIENYALFNRPESRKWANKLAWQVYATPSIVYRTLDNNFNSQNMAGGSSIALPNLNPDINLDVNHTPALGFEIGSGFLYSILKGVKVKAGLQLNYTRYNSKAFHNAHPVVTRLPMHDFRSNNSYEIYRSTPYSNKYGLESVNLHNETFQISLPVGADFRLTGNEELQWNVGVSIQPTYVAGGKSYLISSDKRNYVKESAMINRWNLNAGFETFISFKANNGLTWQIGPQLRTQLFSTNNKQFTVEEKIINYGVKLGVFKTVK